MMNDNVEMNEEKDLISELTQEEIEEMEKDKERAIALNENSPLTSVLSEEEIEAMNKEKERIIALNKKKERFNCFKKDYNRSSLGVLLFFAILQVVCSMFLVVGAVIVVLLTISKNTNIDLLQNFDYSKILKSNSFIIVPIMYLVGYCITILLTLLFNKKLIYKNQTVDEKIRKLTAKEYLIYIAAAIALWGIGVVIGNFPELIGVQGEDQTEMIFGSYDILMAAMAMFGAPFIEEIVCRKMFIDRSAKNGGLLVVLMSALCFALMHGNSAQFFLAFGMGLVAGVVYYKTRNIFYTIGIHFIINTWASTTEIAKVFLDSNAKNYVQNCDFIDTIWYIASGVLVLVCIIVTILNCKSELFKVEKDNEFNGKCVFKAPAFKTFYIITVILTATSTLLSLTSNILTNTNFDYTKLLLLIPDILFIIFIIWFNAFLNEKMSATTIE